MAQIHGQIDSLKQIRKTLDSKGISRFNSVNELHDFLKNYKTEEKRIQNHYEKEVAKDINDIEQRIDLNQYVLKSQRNKSLEKLNRQIIASFNGMTNIKNKYNRETSA